MAKTARNGSPARPSKERGRIRSLVKSGRLLEYTNSQYALNIVFLKGTFDDYKAVCSWMFGKELAATELDGDGSSYCAFTLRAQIPESGAFGYVIWLQDAGPDTIVNAVHECVHAAGFALADCNLPTDISDEKTSEIAAYLTADMFRFVVSKMFPDFGVKTQHEILGEFKKKAGTNNR